MLFLLVMLVTATISGCERPDPEVGTIAVFPTVGSSQPGQAFNVTRDADDSELALDRPPTPPLPSYAGTPTPDSTRTISDSTDQAYHYHRVSAGETLSQIAIAYGSNIEELMTLNGLEGGDFLSVDQVILVPGRAEIVGPSFKIVPDSEIVYGPTVANFDVHAMADLFNGKLLNYQEEVEGNLLNGPEIVSLVAYRQSINPRLILAIIEHLSGWVTGIGRVDEAFPLGYVRTGYEGLYQQLNWAANLVSLGYYGRSEGGVGVFDVGQDHRVAFANDINDGTAGLQLFLGASQSTTYEQWQQAVGPDGFFATYSSMFGNPFAYTFDPLWPEELEQPPLLLPWGPGEIWYFTGGPHGGWASGSAWAALDFTPEDENLGCNVAPNWLLSVSDGLVVRSEYGAVVIDLDGDGYSGTGWNIVYFHVADQDRVPAGSFVRAGDQIGHPSCEGGFSNWAHLHIARLYNGRWVAADGEIPFIMDGWQSQGLGWEYDGLLIKGDQIKEACECRSEENEIVVD